MRKILLVGAILALSACGSKETTTETNTVTADNMMVDENLMLDANASMNATTMDANGAVDANTANLMVQDATHNDADTNLANGL